MTTTIPVPRGVPMLGSILDFQRDPLGTYERAMNEYGDVVRFDLGPPGLRMSVYAVFDPDSVARVLTDRGTGFRKDNQAYVEVAAAFGNGLLTSQDSLWLRQKRTVQPLFTKQRTTRYLDEVVDEAGRLISRWQGLSRVDLHETMVDLAMRNIGRILFGDDMERAAEVFLRDFPVLSDHAFRRGISPVRLPSSWPTPANRRAARSRSRVAALVDELLAARRRSAHPRDDMLSLLFGAIDPETGSRLSNEEIRDQILVFLFAGHETSATALTFTLHLLGRHPWAQEKVFDEVTRIVGSRRPHAYDLPELTYTTQVIKEAMRLYPPVQFIGRQAVSGGRFGGFDIPPGSAVITSAWATHRSPRLWDSPADFDPSRFTPAAEAGRHRYAYFPFGGGPRSCIGNHFAMLELVLDVALLVRAFRFSALTTDPALDSAVTLRPGGHVWSEITPRLSQS